MHLNYINGKIKIVEAAQCNVIKSVEIDVVENVNAETEPINFTPLNNIQTFIPEDKTAESNYKNLDQDLMNLSCPACNNGDIPTGAHLCAICKNAVHVIDECSLPFGDEEGYGEQRICKKCSVEKSTPDILASSQIENWRGLAKQKSRKRTAKYLGQNVRAIQDSLSYTKNRNIPILKNGSIISLGPIKLGKQIFSIINTCAFDSIFQIMLAASLNYPLLQEKVCYQILY